MATPRVQRFGAHIEETLAGYSSGPLEGGWDGQYLSPNINLKEVTPL